MMNEAMLHRLQEAGDPRLFPPVVWAYVGDAVFELYVRLRLTESTQRIQLLHRSAVSYVRAGGQAEILKNWHARLSEDEKGVVRRGRNVKSAVPRNADMGEYRQSTGFEALVGYLYLMGRWDRLWELLDTVDIQAM